MEFSAELKEMLEQSARDLNENDQLNQHLAESCRALIIAAFVVNQGSASYDDIKDFVSSLMLDGMQVFIQDKFVALEDGKYYLTEKVLEGDHCRGGCDCGGDDCGDDCGDCDCCKCG